MTSPRLMFIKHGHVQHSSTPPQYNSSTVYQLPTFGKISHLFKADLYGLN